MSPKFNIKYHVIALPSQKIDLTFRYYHYEVPGVLVDSSQEGKYVLLEYSLNSKSAKAVVPFKFDSLTEKCRRASVYHKHCVIVDRESDSLSELEQQLLDKYSSEILPESRRVLFLYSYLCVGYTSIPPEESYEGADQIIPMSASTKCLNTKLLEYCERTNKPISFSSLMFSHQKEERQYKLEGVSLYIDISYHRQLIDPSVLISLRLKENNKSNSKVDEIVTFLRSCKVLRRLYVSVNFFDVYWEVIAELDTLEDLSIVGLWASSGVTLPVTEFRKKSNCRITMEVSDPRNGTPYMADIVNETLPAHKSYKDMYAPLRSPPSYCTRNNDPGSVIVLERSCRFPVTIRVEKRAKSSKSMI